MKDIRQIKIINKALTSEKEKFLAELLKVNDIINKKLAVIKKMSFYHGEYSNMNNLKVSRSIPILNKNLDAFSEKIKKIIRFEEDEIKKMMRIREGILASVEQVDKKIRLMDIFEQKHTLTQQQNEEKNAQKHIDDILLRRLTGDESE